MRHLDLFSGIGGFALAARNVGWETVGFCEIDPWCQKILAKNFPGVPIYDDIKKIVADTNGKRGNGRTEKQGAHRRGIFAGSGGITDGTTTVGPVDIITGGFPCQDISYAGKGAGIEGERSGLWTELARIIGEVRPRYTVLENVSALLSRGLDRVAGDLAEIGYDCEWHCIPASHIGAPHRRDRIWIICYPSGDGEPVGAINAETFGLQGDVANAYRRPLGRFTKSWRECDFWAIEPDVGRVANGVPRRVDRLRGLGNAIVPQVAELIFKAIPV